MMWKQLLRTKSLSKHPDKVDAKYGPEWLKISWKNVVGTVNDVFNGING